MSEADPKQAENPKKSIASLTSDSASNETSSGDSSARKVASKNDSTADSGGAKAIGSDSAVVPRLSRRGRFRINANDLIRIGLVGTLLVGIIVMREPCADGVASFVTSFDEVDAGVAPTHESIGDLRRLTDEEIRAAFRGDGDLLENDRSRDDAGSPSPLP